MMQIYFRRRWLVLLILAMMLGMRCHASSTRKVMDEKLFVQVYCDVVAHADLLAEGRRAAFVDSVLNSHRVTRDDFQRTVAFYAGNVERWEKVFEAIVAELERREKAADVAADSVQAGER
ncbi:MAG: DUF4296 domain-containing protein [candidate division KSB1 bacterium]|nr:DUF4296 domain-containing protein [candidate division KSB1 bacterium]MDZ7340591.1 DUF4296 domain-containing protein [candidate division KSB1 bacterium]